MRLLKDFGDHFVFPVLVDSTSISTNPAALNGKVLKPRRARRLRGAIRALIDMPLNSIPATTSVAALEEKRAAAAGKALVDYAFWGGAVEGNAPHLKCWPIAGVLGFKAFLVPSGVDEFDYA